MEARIVEALPVAAPPPADEAARHAGLDTVRVVAVTLVAVIHVATLRWGVLGDDFWAVNLWDSIARPAVGLFLMTSGALLLPKTDEPLGVFFSKRLGKIALPLLVWSLAYLGPGVLSAPGAFVSALRKLVAGPVHYHLWFMYVLIGLYLAMPLLRRMYAAMEPVHIRYLLVLWVLAGTQGMATQLNGGVRLLGFDILVLPMYGGFLFLGAHLRDRRMRPAAAAAMYAVGTAGTFAGTAWHSAATSAPSTVFYSGFSPFVLAATAGLFLLAGSVRLPWPSAAAELGTATFGVYLAHVMLLEHAVRRLPAHPFDMAHPVLAIPVLSLGVAAATFALVLAARRVPLLRRVV